MDGREVFLIPHGGIGDRPHSFYINRIEYFPTCGVCRTRSDKEISGERCLRSRIRMSFPSDGRRSCLASSRDGWWVYGSSGPTTVATSLDGASRGRSGPKPKQ